MNNLPCSEACANAYTKYIGREDVTIGAEDRGILADGKVITGSVAAEARAVGEGDLYAGLLRQSILDEIGADPEGEQP